MVVLLTGARVLKVDSHTHILPKEIPAESYPSFPLKLVQYETPTEKGFAAKLEFKTGKLFRELKPNCFDANEVLRQCNACGVDIQVVCTVPVMFQYDMPPEQAYQWVEFLNDDLSRTCNEHPDRLVGLGTLPLQDTQASIREIRRCSEQGIRGFQIGSHINAYRGTEEDGTTPIIKHLPLNHPDLRPVFAELERQGACIMVHPWDMEWWCPKEYWQPWLVGMPSETTLAGTALILGGVLSAFPALRVMMSHGGGALPYLKGRIDWGYRCRPDLVAPDCPHMPSELLKRLYFDSITHDEGALRFMVGLVGPEKVMLGSDYPFPLGEVPSIAPLSEETLHVYPGQLIQDATMLTFTEKRALLGLTALEWLGIDPAKYNGRLKDQSIKAQLVLPPKKTTSRLRNASDKLSPNFTGIEDMEKEPDEVKGSKGMHEAKSEEEVLHTAIGETLAGVDELSEMPISLLTSSAIPLSSANDAESLSVEPYALSRSGSKDDLRDSHGWDSESSLDDSNHGFQGLVRRSVGAHGSSSSFSKALEYFPIARKHRTRSFSENPLAELGNQKDVEYPISEQIRALFPRGEVMAAAGHTFSRPCLGALVQGGGLFDAVSARLLKGFIPSSLNDEKESLSNDGHHLHKPSREILGELLGCDPEDVILGLGPCEELIKLINAYVHPQIFSKRRKVMCLGQDFHDNITIVRNFLLKTVVNALLAARPIFEEADGDEMARLLHQSQQGQEYKRLTAIFLNPQVPEEEQFKEIERTFMEIIEPSGGRGIYREDDMVATIERCHNELAGALLPSICYRTSQLLDMRRINHALIDRNVPCVWDMAHSVGDVQHTLASDRILCGAGWGYVHSSGLPGGTGVIYQNASLIREMSTRNGTCIRPISVNSSIARGTYPSDVSAKLVRGIQRHRESDMEVLAFEVVTTNLQIISQFQVPVIMELKDALCECLIQSLDYFFHNEIAAGIFSYITPLEKERRGTTICFSLAGVDAKRVQRALYTDKYKLGYKFEIDMRPKTDDIDIDIFCVTAHYFHMSFTETVNLAFAIHNAYKHVTIFQNEPSS